MSEQNATNVQWHSGEINRPERAQLLGHGGATLWFTGLSGSGKSTIAVALEQGWTDLLTIGELDVGWCTVGRGVVREDREFEGLSGSRIGFDRGQKGLRGRSIERPEDVNGATGL